MWFFSAHQPNINEHHAVVDNVIVVVHHDPIEPPLFMAAAVPSGLPVGFSSWDGTTTLVGKMVALAAFVVVGAVVGALVTSDGTSIQSGMVVS
jgi:hypothetical protein